MTSSPDGRNECQPVKYSTSVLCEYFDFIGIYFNDSTHSMLHLLHFYKCCTANGYPDIEHSKYLHGQEQYTVICEFYKRYQKYYERTTHHKWHTNVFVKQPLNAITDLNTQIRGLHSYRISVPSPSVPAPTESIPIRSCKHLDPSPHVPPHHFVSVPTRSRRSVCRQIIASYYKTQTK